MEKINELTSENIVQQNIERLKEIFPTAFSEGKIVVEELQALVGEYMLKDKEFYQMTWAGKTEAQREANKVSTGTLRPCKEESKDWESTGNIFIEGDNLEVLKLLQKSYSNKIKMIYIDPPYNTGKDFVYKDNYKDNLNNYLELTGQADKQGKKFSTNTDSDGRYHSNWLNMMYPRLKLARNLLKNDGVIFLSIDDNEDANLKKLCNEIFGEENYIGTFPRITKKAGKTTDLIAKNNDYILVFSKSFNTKFNTYSHTDEGYKHSDEYEQERGKYKLSQTLDYGSIQYSPSLDYEIIIDNYVFRPGGVSIEKMKERKLRNPKSDFCWRWSKDLFEFGLKNNFIVVKESSNRKRIYTKTYQRATIIKNGSEYSVDYADRTKSATTLDLIENIYSNDNSKKDLSKIFDSKIFDYSKPVSLIKTLSFLTTDNNDIILDFFAGSGTTAHAVMELNLEDGGRRKSISVQLPESIVDSSVGYDNIADISKERIRRAGQRIKQQNKDKEGIENLDTGFRVFKLDSSNILAWDTSIEEFEGQLDMFTENNGDHIKADRTEEDILFEIILKYGLELTLPIKEKMVGESKIYNIGFGSMFICLSDKIKPDIATSIGEWYKESADTNPSVIFKDSGFTNDADKTNTVQALRQAGIYNVKSI